MLIVQMLVGGALLAFGRRLFWLFVGACGFAVGLTMTARFVATRSEWLILLAAFALGILGAVLALFFQRLAIGVAGFLAGTVIAVQLFDALSLEGAVVFWMACVVGGVLGAVLTEIVFDYALIGLSCLAGSSLIVGALRPGGMAGLFLWFVLLGLGVAVQVAQMRRKVRPR